MSDNEKEFLHFSPMVQEAIVGWMITDYSFFLKCKIFIDYTYFQDPKLADIVKIIYDIHNIEQMPVKIGTIQTKITSIHYNAKDSRERLELLDRCINFSKNNTSIEILSREMSAWKKLVLLRKSFFKATELYNNRRYDEAANWLKIQMDEITQVSFEKDDSIRFDDIQDFFENRSNMLSEHSCTIGHPLFDELISNGATEDLPALPNEKGSAYNIRYLTKGSLQPGDTTLLMGPSNSGKTTTITTIVFLNLLFKKKVLLITHEQKWEDIKAKICQSISGRLMKEFSYMATDKEMQNVARAIAALAVDNLVYIEYIKPGKMYVEDVIGRIQIEQEKMRAKRFKERQILREKLAKEGKLTVEIQEKLLKEDSENRGFDLVIDDYPAKLRSRAFNGRNATSYDEKSYIYNQFVEAALHYRFHVLVAVQTNRSGYKVSNRDSTENRLLDQGDIADSYGISTIASNVITINRTPSDVASNRIKFHVAKSRSNKQFSTFVSKTDFARGRTHGPWLPAAIFEPGESVTDEAVAMKLGEYERKSKELDNLPKGIPEDKGIQKMLDFANKTNDLGDHYGGEQ